MKRVCAFLAAMAVMLSSCATVGIVDYAAKDAGPVPDHEQAKAQATDAIKYMLKDPASAQFRTFTPFFKMLYSYGVGSSDMLWTMCVEVNSKNSFGGYTGYQWMVVKFRDGQVVRDVNGLFKPENPSYCIEGPADPSRRAPG